MGEGGFHALESWLYDHDYVDLERRRAAFLGSRRTSVWIPASREAVPPVRRHLPHSPAGVPALVRDPGRRQIHLGEPSGVSCEYQHVNEKAARVGGPSRVRS